MMKTDKQIETANFRFFEQFPHTKFFTYTLYLWGLLPQKIYTVLHVSLNAFWFLMIMQRFSLGPKLLIHRARPNISDYTTS